MKTIVKRTPAGFNNLPSIFDELFFNEGTPKNLVKKNIPSVNIKEREDAFEIELSIPGYSKEHISIQVENELLTISAEQVIEELKENEQYTKKEFSLDKFSRSFTLPEIVDVEAIVAKNEHGILFLTLPKNKVLLENKVKTITIS